MLNDTTTKVAGAVVDTQTSSQRNWTTGAIATDAG
jgi:hypothetical protein